VVSGINNGANMGDDTLYSGTVGAAMEGYLFGIPALAFSQTEKGWAHLDQAAEFAKNMVAQFEEANLIGTSPWLLNVNIPNATAQWKNAKLCRLGRRHAAEPVITQLSPRGETMYWIGNAGEAMDDGEGTDFHAAKQGHVTITPLKVDLTDHENASHWSQNLSKLKVWGA
jgi:5'-nucleotidase